MTIESAPPEDGAERTGPGPKRVLAPAPGPSTASGAAAARWWRWAAIAVVAAGVVARFVARSHLWLDEALTVNIARLPLEKIPDALRHDGSPPLYYVVLHGWMSVFGTSTWAVRALSGIFGVAALPLAWRAGDRLGGRPAASAALVLLAVSPFAVHYSTEARMYSLLILLVLAGGLLLERVFVGSSWRPAVGLGLVTGALLLTHYWAMYLIAVVSGALLLLIVRRRNRSGTVRALVAMGTGSLLLVPWLPAFLSQLGRTGAPWGAPGHELEAIFETLQAFAAGFRGNALFSFLLLEGLVVLGVLARAVDGRRLELDLRGREPGRSLALVTFATLALGLAVGRVTGAAWAVRYASIVFPGVLLLVALGAAVFVDTRVRHAVLAAAVALGAAGIVPVVAYERTAAATVAAALRRAAGPGDVVAYCPDQLGPSVSRLLPAGLVQLTFPRATSPERVDWVDYSAVMAAGRMQPFAHMLADRAGPTGDVWLVWSSNYRTLGTKCERLRRQLGEIRPNRQRVVALSKRFPERMGLVRYRPS